jgi:hypothetical protein
MENFEIFPLTRFAGTSAAIRRPKVSFVELLRCIPNHIGKLVAFKLLGKTLYTQLI